MATQKRMARDRYLIFRVTPGEARWIREEAKAQNMTVSEFIRSQVLPEYEEEG